MPIWVAEYTRGEYVFNVVELRAETKEDAECLAWAGYMHLADCLTVTVRRLVVADTALSARRPQSSGGKIRRIA